MKRENPDLYAALLLGILLFRSACFSAVSPSYIRSFGKNRARPAFPDGSDSISRSLHGLFRNGIFLPSFWGNCHPSFLSQPH